MKIRLAPLLSAVGFWQILSVYITYELIYNYLRIVNVSQTKTDRLVKLASQVGVLRSRDLVRHKIPREYLRLAQGRGLLTRVSRGLYVANNAKLTEHHSLVEASKRVPHGVICLLSALRFHGLTTQAPFEVWMGIGEKARMPKLENPRLRIVRFSPRGLQYGVETHRIEGVALPVFHIAKTVADCFKYRNKIGLDVALEALKDCLQKRKASTDQLWQAAKLCR